MALPGSLQSLRFGVSFNQSLANVDLPSELVCFDGLGLSVVVHASGDKKGPVQVNKSSLKDFALSVRSLNFRVKHC